MRVTIGFTDQYDRRKFMQEIDDGEKLPPTVRFMEWNDLFICDFLLENAAEKMITLVEKYNGHVEF